MGGPSTKEPDLLQSPHLTPPHASEGPGLSPHLHQPGRLGLPRAAVALGRNWLLVIHASPSRPVASRWETGGRLSRSSSGDTGEGSRGVLARTIHSALRATLTSLSGKKENHPGSES